MNFFVTETQVSRGLRLIGRNSIGGSGTRKSQAPAESPSRSTRSPPRLHRSTSPHRRHSRATGNRGCGGSAAAPPRLVEESPLLAGSSPERSREEAEKERQEEAAKEVIRVLAFERSAFPSLVDWAFAVLGVSITEKTIASTQRCYRALMKKLHPDKAVQSPSVTDAVDMIQEARAICERSLCPHEVPGVPRNLSVATHPSKAGARRFLLQWLPPERLEAAPVQRYIIAVADPRFAGAPVRLSTLEPDYSQELGRYVPLEELRSYEVAEEDVSARVPGLFSHKTFTLMVTAANKVGQSSWVAITVDLSSPTMPLSRSFSTKSNSGFPPVASVQTSESASELSNYRLRQPSPGICRHTLPPQLTPLSINHGNNKSIPPTSPSPRRNSPSPMVQPVPSPQTPASPLCIPKNVATPQARGAATPQARGGWVAGVMSPQRASIPACSVIRFRTIA